MNTDSNSADQLQAIVDKVTSFNAEYIIMMNEANSMLGRIIEEKKSLGRIHTSLESLRESVSALSGDVRAIRSDGISSESKAIVANIVSEFVTDLAHAAWRLRNFREGS